MQTQEISAQQEFKDISNGYFGFICSPCEPFFAILFRDWHAKRVQIKKPCVLGSKCCQYLLTMKNFLSSLPKEKCFGLFKHECYHLILDHCTNRAHSDKELWNIAADLAINSLIPVLELPDGLLPAQEDLVAQPTTNDKDIKRIVLKLSQFFGKNLPPPRSAEYYYKSAQRGQRSESSQRGVGKEKIQPVWFRIGDL